MNIFEILGREKPLFEKDLIDFEKDLYEIISNSRFMIIGGAGSIGQSVTKAIIRRNPIALHVVDINENNIVELVRDIRSSIGYIDGDFQTYAIDCGSKEFEVLINSSPNYDFYLNLSALKHVRSEKDPYTLMRIIEVNILNTIKTIQLAKSNGAKKYFGLSTDKATNPVNMMGASKRLMEKFLIRESDSIDIGSSRFANIAFSDGSLLHGFRQRIAKNQPISAPYDISRYFMTLEESGDLCLLSCLLGFNRDIFFPKLNNKFNMITFSEIAKRFIENLGFQPYYCQTEDEARNDAKRLIQKKKWPLFLFKSDTTGEKEFEEFHNINDDIDNERFTEIGVIKNHIELENIKLVNFIEEIEKIRSKSNWNRLDIIELFKETLPEFKHFETGKFLNDKM